jgi:Fe2+ transport system protein FeoA
MSLARGSVGSRFRITGVQPGGALARRLMEMGLVEGMEVVLVRRAPLGDPLQIRVGDYDLSLRASDAELVDVDAV